MQLGAQSYSGFSRVNGGPSGNLIVYLSPGANAVATADRVRKFMQQAKRNFPAGMDYVIPYDSTVFVRAAIKEVLITLFEAIGLVIIVVFLFLQNWRATLIPLLTVPVAIVGTFALFPLLGFSINMTSMFGLVLAIGIVVDDAIVVVEAVQRHIDEGLRRTRSHHPRHARKSPPRSSRLPAFWRRPSSRWRSSAASAARSTNSSLLPSPPPCCSPRSTRCPSARPSALMLLRPKMQGRGLPARFFTGFDRVFEWTRSRYLSAVGILIRKSSLALLGLVFFWLAAGALFRHLPTGFLPEEDQGTIFVSIRLPDAASVERADAATRKVEEIVRDIPAVAGTFTIGGLDIATRTSSSNVATVIVRLKPWDDRTGKNEQLRALIGRMQGAFFRLPEASIFAFGLPPILGLSTTGGFQFMVEDRTGGSVQDLAQAADLLVQAARRRRELGNMISTFRSNVPNYKVDVDLAKVQTLGVPVGDVYNTLQTFLGGLYVNDFNVFGRTWQVVIQSEPEFRNEASDINRFYTRNGEGGMVPLGTLASVTPSAGPDVVYRYNRFRAVQVLGGPAAGYSSGQATNAMEELAAAVLPAGYSYEWTGTTYQEKEAQGHEGVIFGFAAVLVFLFLAALYESWSIPFAVLLALPLGLFGALFAVWIRSYPYDIYTQIGIVTLIGLAAKNAILIVEFARMRHEDGESISSAALEAARLRLRPILMTSFAFILGVTPLLVATGAGAASRRSLGTAVFGGMNAATLLAIFLVPVLYFVIQRVVERKRKPALGIPPLSEQPE